MPYFLGEIFKEKKTHFYVLCQQTIAITVAEKHKKIKLTTESMQESTGKEVFKNIEIESGPALGKEAKQ